MRIVCWQTILMKYHTLFFFWKLGKMLQNLSSGAVVIGALRVNQCNVSFHLSYQCNGPQPDAVSGTQTYEDLILEPDGGTHQLTLYNKGTMVCFFPLYTTWFDRKSLGWFIFMAQVRSTGLDKIFEPEIFLTISFNMFWLLKRRNTSLR